MARAPRGAASRGLAGGLALVAAIVGVLVLGPNTNPAPQHLSDATGAAAGAARQGAARRRTHAGSPCASSRPRSPGRTSTRRGRSSARTCAAASRRSGGRPARTRSSRTRSTSSTSRRTRSTRRTRGARCSRWRCSRARARACAAQVFFLELKKLGSGRASRWVVDNWVPQGSRGGAAVSNLADSAEAAANGQAVILRGRAALLPEDAAVDDDLDVAGRGARVLGRASGSGSSATSWRSRAACSSSCSSSPPSRARRSPRTSSATGRTSRSSSPAGSTPTSCPAGPWTHVGKLTENGELEQQLFVLGSDSTLARDEFLRLLYGAQVSLEVGRRRDASLAPARLDRGRGRRLLPRLGRHDDLAARRPDDGLPVPALRDHARGDARDAPEPRDVRVPRARASSRSSSSSGCSAGSTPPA